MRIPRTRRGEAYFSLFSHLFEKETAVMTHSIAPRGRNEGGIFFLLPHNESNVRWHPVLESFAVPLTNGLGFSIGAIVFGWAVFNPHFFDAVCAAVAHCFHYFFFYSLMFFFLSWRQREAKQSEACRKLLWRERFVHRCV